MQKRGGGRKSKKKAIKMGALCKSTKAPKAQ